MLTFNFQNCQKFVPCFAETSPALKNSWLRAGNSGKNWELTFTTARSKDGSGDKFERRHYTVSKSFLLTYQ